MDIELRFFAGVREALGVTAERVSVPPEVVTLGHLRGWLRARGGAWATALADGRPLRMACDRNMCDHDTRLSDGCEVAFFPPVTGG